MQDQYYQIFQFFKKSWNSEFLNVKNSYLKGWEAIQNF